MIVEYLLQRKGVVQEMCETLYTENPEYDEYYREHLIPQAGSLIATLEAISSGIYSEDAKYLLYLKALEDDAAWSITHALVPWLIVNHPVFGAWSDTDLQTFFGLYCQQEILYYNRIREDTILRGEQIDFTRIMMCNSYIEFLRDICSRLD